MLGTEDEMGREDVEDGTQVHQGIEVRPVVDEARCFLFDRRLRRHASRVHGVLVKVRLLQTSRRNRQRHRTV